jgi:hypothetical protein
MILQSTGSPRLLIPQYSGCEPAGKLGFRREAHYRQNIFFKGAWGDEYLYALLKSDYSQASLHRPCKSLPHHHFARHASSMPVRCRAPAYRRAGFAGLLFLWHRDAPLWSYESLLINRAKSMRNLPPTATLRAFEVATRHATFTSAAEELFITQSAVSHQLKT